MRRIITAMLIVIAAAMPASAMEASALPFPSSVTLSWSGTEGAVHYDIYSGDDFIIRLSSGNRSYTVDRLSSDTHYDFSIAARDGENRTLDAAFVKEMLLAVAKNWNGASSDVRLEALLPESRRKELEERLAASAKELLAAGLEVGYSSEVRTGFKVGAAVVSSSGRIYTGCNVENSSYGATICAERNAITTGVAAEGRGFSIDLIAVASEGESPAPPCAVCLQVIAEFASPDTLVILSASGKVEEYRFRELLPKPFVLTRI